MRIMLAMLSLATATAGFAATAPSSGLSVMQYSDLQWHPKPALPPGAFSAVMRGDPPGGAYDFVGRFPAKFTVPEHWHTNDVHVIMTHGSMVIRPKGGADVRIDEGGYFFLPGELRYVAICEQPCTFVAHGEKPFDIFYTNAGDDPRSKLKK